MRLCLFLTLVTSWVFASGDTVLSRIAEIASDTERVNRLYERGYSLRSSAPALAMSCASLALETARRSASPRHRAKAHSLMGVLLYRRGDLRSARAHHEEALKLRRACGDESGVAVSLTNLANIHTDLRRWAAAEKALMEALHIHERLGDQHRKALCLVNLGAMKHSSGNREAALSCYKLALRESEAINDYETRAYSLNNLAVLEAEAGRTEQALALHFDALKIREIMDDQVGITDSYLNLCEVYLQCAKPAEAGKYLDMARQLAASLNYFEGSQAALLISSTLYESSTDFRRALLALRTYHRRQDSVTALSETPVNPEATETRAATPGLHNRGLLLMVISMCIVIPFILFSYRR